MPILHSGKKQMRKSSTNKAFNETRKRAMKETVKDLKKHVIAKTVTKESISRMQATIDKSAKRGVIKKNTASRMKSRLVKLISKTKSTV